MRLLVYTLLRLGLVLAAAGLLYLLGLRSWFLWIAAVIVGALLSFLVLGRQREGAVAVLAQYDPLREERPAFSPKVEADAAYEDAIVDAAEPRSGGGDVLPGSAVGKDDKDAEGSTAQTHEEPERPSDRTDGPGDEAGGGGRPPTEDR